MDHLTLMRYAHQDVGGETSSGGVKTQSMSMRYRVRLTVYNMGDGSGLYMILVLNIPRGHSSAVFPLTHATHVKFGLPYLFSLCLWMQQFLATEQDLRQGKDNVIEIRMLEPLTMLKLIELTHANTHTGETEAVKFLDLVIELLGLHR
jgi:hypothetical protein